MGDKNATSLFSKNISTLPGTKNLQCFSSLQIFNCKFPKVSENERTVEYVGENGAKFLPTNIMHLTFYADGIRLDEGRFRSGFCVLNFFLILSNFLFPKKPTHTKKYKFLNNEIDQCFVHWMGQILNY